MVNNNFLNLGVFWCLFRLYPCPGRKKTLNPQPNDDVIALNSARPTEGVRSQEHSGDIAVVAPEGIQMSSHQMEVMKSSPFQEKQRILNSSHKNEVFLNLSSQITCIQALGVGKAARETASVEHLLSPGPGGNPEDWKIAPVGPVC